MRIGISINGEGRGHITRMTALADGLKEKYELFFWASPRDIPGLEKRFACPVFPLPPLNIVMNDNRLDLWQTGRDNLDILVNSGIYLKEQTQRMESLRIDGLISDFEPFLAKSANKCGIPVLQFNHPGIVLRSTSLKPDAVLAKIVAYNMSGKSEQEMISSFYNGDIGPLLRQEIRQAEPVHGDFLLVYLRPGVDRMVCRALDRMGNRNYRVFPGKDHDFVRSLAGCGGVITHAGHQLLSEALSLKKPILSFPIEGQYEQRLNARMLEVSGRGQAGRLATLEMDLTSFITGLDAFPRQRDQGPDRFCFTDDLEKSLMGVDRFLGRHADRWVRAAS